jgi:hypothetical protein
MSSAPSWFVRLVQSSDVEGWRGFFAAHHPKPSPLGGALAGPSGAGAALARG